MTETETLEVKSVCPKPAGVLIALRDSWLTFVVPGVGLSAALLLGVLSGKLGYWTDIGPGAGFFPILLSGLLALLSLIWLGQSTRNALRSSAEPTASSGPLPETEARVEDAADGNSPQTSERALHPLGTVVGLALVAAVIETLGFQLTLFIFLLAQLRWGRVRWLVALPVSIAGSFGVFFLFTSVLAVYLPPSSIPFLAQFGF